MIHDARRWRVPENVDEAAAAVEMHTARRSHLRARRVLSLMLSLGIVLVLIACSGGSGTKTAKDPLGRTWNVPYTLVDEGAGWASLEMDCIISSGVTTTRPDSFGVVAFDADGNQLAARFTSHPPLQIDIPTSTKTLVVSGDLGGIGMSTKIKLNW